MTAIISVPRATPPGAGGQSLLSEVAKLACESNARQKSIAEHFGVTTRTAARWIARARLAGFHIPPVRRGLYDRAEVARVANQAYKHRPMSLAVAEHFQIPRRHATSLLSLARLAGWPIPHDVQGWAGPPGSAASGSHTIDGLQLVCACGSRFPVAGGGVALTKHTLKAHRRPPTPAEKTPRAAGKVAA